MATFVEIYRGRGVYRFKNDPRDPHCLRYGDETERYARTLFEARARIDNAISEEMERRPEHVKYWDSLDRETRILYRSDPRLSDDGSVSELAYQDFLSRTA